MTDVLLSPIRLSELEVLIQNSVVKALTEREALKPRQEETPSDFTKKYISRQQFMKERNIKSDVTPWKMENRGELTPFRFGKEVFYLRSQVDKLMKKAR